MEFYIVLLLSVVIAILWSVGSIIAKRVDTLLGNSYASLLFLFVLSVTILAIVPFFQISINPKMLVLSVASGLLDAVGYLLFFKSLQTEQASNTYSLVLLQVLVLVLFGIFFLHEPISVRVALGMVLILSGTFSISYKDGHGLNMGLVPAIIGNVVWGLSWVAYYFAYAAGGNFVDPLALAYLTAFLAVLAWVLLSRQRRPSAKMVRKGLLLGVAAALFSALANFGFAFLESINVVAIASVFSNMQPVFVSLMAYFVYRERLTRVNLAGLAIALAGVSLILF